MLLCDRAKAVYCKQKAEETGIRHAVIDVSQDGGKGFQVVTIWPHEVNALHAQMTHWGKQGNITTLFFSDDPLE